MINDNEKIEELGINGLKIIQNKKYFCFGTDSVLLANFVESKNKNNVIVDFCTGSGIIPIIISAKREYKKIYAVELQNEMYDLLSRNINLNELNNNIVPIHDDIKNVSKIREKIIKNENIDSVDIIVCNPPYKKCGTGILNEHEVKYIARHEIYCNLEDIFSSSSKLLKTRGKLYLVHKPDRLADLIEKARKYNLEAKKMRFVYPRVDSKPSIVLIEYVRNGGNELIIEEPLIEFNDDGTYKDWYANL